MKRFFSFLLAALVSVNAFAQTSTINPNIPAANSPLQSGPMRANFAAAYSDVNNAYAIMLQKANNLSDVASASTARGNLGVAIGTNVEAWSAVLDYLASLNIATAQGNSTKVQLSSGTTTLNHCVKFDTNGNTVDSGAACGSGSGTVTTSGSPVNGDIATFSAPTVITTASKTGTGAVVLSNSPALVTPALGTPASGVMTNVTGTASGLTSGITNALKSASTTVDVSAATAPTGGQVLTATDSTHATWISPAGGGATLTSGSAAPTGACTSGNGYTDESDGNAFYICIASSWVYNGYSNWTINSTPGWDPYNSSYMNLSANNTVATVVGGGNYNYGGISATPAKAGGKRYFEMTLSVTTYSQAGIGTFVTQNNQGGSWGQSGDARQLAWNPSGNVMLPNSVVIGTAQNWSGGSTLCFAVDIPNKLIWLRVGSGNWNNSGAANPDTGVGGFNFTNMGPGPIFIGTNISGAAGATAIINLGTSAFAQTPPTTFTSWIH